MRHHRVQDRPQHHRGPVEGHHRHLQAPEAAERIGGGGEQREPGGAVEPTELSGDRERGGEAEGDHARGGGRLPGGGGQLGQDRGGGGQAVDRIAVRVGRLEGAGPGHHEAGAGRAHAGTHRVVERDAAAGLVGGEPQHGGAVGDLHRDDRLDAAAVAVIGPDADAAGRRADEPGGVGAAHLDGGGAGADGPELRGAAGGAGLLERQGEADRVAVGIADRHRQRALCEVGPVGVAVLQPQRRDRQLGRPVADLDLLVGLRQQPGGGRDPEPEPPAPRCRRTARGRASPAAAAGAAATPGLEGGSGGEGPARGKEPSGHGHRRQGQGPGHCVGQQGPSQEQTGEFDQGPVSSGILSQAGIKIQCTIFEV